MASAIKLVATDLDGTLLGGEETPAEFSAFREVLAELSQRWQTRWGIITGRQVQATRQIVSHFISMKLVPEFVVAEDARIFSVAAGGRLVPHMGWNVHVDARRAWLKWRSRHRLLAWRHKMMQRFPQARDVSRQGLDVWFKLRSPDEAQEAEAYLETLVGDQREYLVFRWALEVCLAPAIGTKGDALARLSRKFGVDPMDVFAVGDGANDISMLNGRVAAMPACVANASESVQRTVASAAGYVCRRENIHGVIEALNAYAGDRRSG